MNLDDSYEKDIKKFYPIKSYLYEFKETLRNELKLKKLNLIN